MTLCSTKLATHSLHVSVKEDETIVQHHHTECTPEAPSINVANLSLDLQGWRFFPYSECSPQHRQHLLAGSVIQLYHPEGDAYLCASSACYKRKPTLIRFDGRQPVKTFFVVEKPEPLLGGIINVSEAVRFRHATSGRYLAILRGAAIAADCAAPMVSRGNGRFRSHSASFSFRGKLPLLSERREVVLVSPMDLDSQEFQDSTLFSLHPVAAVGDAITLSAQAKTETLRLQHVKTQFWLHNTNEFISRDKASWSGSGSSQGSYKFIATRDRHDEDAFVMVRGCCMLAIDVLMHRKMHAASCAASSNSHLMHSFI